MSKPFLRGFKSYLKRLTLYLLRSLPISSEKVGSPKGFYKSTRDWITRYQASNLPIFYKEIYPSHWIYRVEPKTIDKSSDWRFSVGYLGSKVETPTTFVALIPHGRVCGSNGVVITPDDQLLADVSIEFGVMSENAKDHSILKKFKLPKVVKTNDTVAVLSAVGSTAYFHWMFDVLPRIYLLRCSRVINQIDKFLVNEMRFKFQEETLNVLGIPKEKIIATDESFHIKAEKLVVPSLPGITGSMPQWACNFLREEFLRGIATDKADRSQRIYISRAMANHRRVINEDELIDFLIQLNFKIYLLESLPFMEQVSVFYHSKFIIAPHGGGLTNLVFCPPGSKVIELFSPNYVNGCYRAISNMVDLDYWYLLGEGQPPSEHTGNHLLNTGGQDMRIDINLLAKTIELAGIEH